MSFRPNSQSYLNNCQERKKAQASCIPKTGNRSEGETYLVTSSRCFAGSPIFRAIEIVRKDTSSSHASSLEICQTKALGPDTETVRSCNDGAKLACRLASIQHASLSRSTGTSDLQRPNPASCQSNQSRKKMDLSYQHPASHLQSCTVPTNPSRIARPVLSQQPGYPSPVSLF